MGAVKALSLAATFIVAQAGLAMAADLLPPPPPEPVVLADPDFSGWYIRGDVGVGINQLTSLKSTFNLRPGFGPLTGPPDARNERNSLTNSVFISAGVGYQFNNWFRADVTLEHRTDANFAAVSSYNQGFYANPQTLARQNDFYRANISQNIAMLNGYVDLGTWASVTPYLGAGLGYAMHRVSYLTDNNVSFAKDKTTGTLAWALMAGLGFNVNPNLKLELGYRYLNMGTADAGEIACLGQPPNACPFEVQHYTLASHDFHIGMRWLLNVNGYGGGQSLYWGQGAGGGVAQGAGIGGGYPAASGGGYAAAGGGYPAAGGGGYAVAAPGSLTRRY